MSKKKVLFLCTGNSCRSQMAEGLLKSFAGERFEVQSAGTHPSSLHPLSIKIMQELEIDISPQRSESISKFREEEFDYVITVCNQAREACPVFPGGGKKMHWDIKDPVGPGSEAERLALFRKIRDELSRRIKDFIADAEKK